MMAPCDGEVLRRLRPPLGRKFVAPRWWDSPSLAQIYFAYLLFPRFRPSLHPSPAPHLPRFPFAVVCKVRGATNGWLLQPKRCPKNSSFFCYTNYIPRPEFHLYSLKFVQQCSTIPLFVDATAGYKIGAAMEQFTKLVGISPLPAP